LNYFFVAVFAVLFAVIFSFNTNVFAAFNEEINYQGKLLDGTSSPVADGSYSMTFKLYTVATGGSEVWSETQSVPVQSGLFSVMLGSSTALTGVDFNQTLYLGINVAGDGEMTPRKVLGAVPAAFEANHAADSDTVGGVASTSLLRSDVADAIAATTASTLLSITQNGTGAILDLINSSAASVFTATNSGVGIGTTTPDYELVIDGTMSLTGGLIDNNGTSGQAGYVLQSTNGGLQWVATSTLGFSGVTTFVGLTDTQSSLTANRILFTNSGGTALTDSASLTFDGVTVAANASLSVGSPSTPALFASSSTKFVGIGTNEPKNFLHVQASAVGGTTYNADDIFVLEKSGNANWNFIAGTSGDASMLFSDTTRAVGGIRFRHVNNSLGFWTNSNSTYGAESMILTSAGNLGIGTSTPGKKLSVAGSMTLTGAFYDATDSAGTNGYVLQSTGSGTQWVATSSLGFGASGASAFLDLTDTFSSFTDGNILFSSASAVVDSALFSYASSTHTLTIGGMTISDALTTHTVSSTTTIPINEPYAWTLATGIDHQPLIRVDTTSGNEMVYIGNGSGDVFIGDVGSPSDLVFEESSTISGQGTNTITLGVAGDIFNVAVNLGIGSSTPYKDLSIAGDMALTGAFYDATDSAGTNGYVLQSTGSGTQWVATSTLGIGGGASTFVGLTDTQSSLTANTILFTNSGGTALTDSANFTFNGTDLGLGNANGIAWGGVRYLYASTTNDSIAFGEGAGATFTAATTYNVALGFGAGQYASTTFADSNNYIGYYVITTLVITPVKTI